MTTRTQDLMKGIFSHHKSPFSLSHIIFLPLDLLSWVYTKILSKREYLFLWQIQRFYPTHTHKIFIIRISLKIFYAISVGCDVNIRARARKKKFSHSSNRHSRRCIVVMEIYVINDDWGDTMRWLCCIVKVVSRNNHNKFHFLLESRKNCLIPLTVETKSAVQQLCRRGGDKPVFSFFLSLICCWHRTRIDQLVLHHDYKIYWSLSLCVICVNAMMLKRKREIKFCNIKEKNVHLIVI